MTGSRIENPEVLVAAGGIVRLSAADLAAIPALALANRRKRARFCAHRSAGDLIHEMMICLHRGTYIRPHRHPGKSESFHMLEGEVAVVLFDSDGAIRESIRLAPFQTGGAFYYRLDEPLYHTVLVTTPHALFHETTNGPFDPGDTEFAPWSPAEGDPSVEDYLGRIRARISP